MPAERAYRGPYRYPLLLPLLVQLDLSRAEIVACCASHVHMPTARREDFEDALGGLVAEQQRYWERFRPEDHQAVQRARARVVGNRAAGVRPSMR